MIRRFLKAPKLLMPVVVAAVALASAPTSGHGYPRPSPYPITWELDFISEAPKRVEFKQADGSIKAYWYVVYSVMNRTGQEQQFFPLFEILDSRGNVSRTDRLIPREVFDAVKGRSGRQFLKSALQIAGQLRVGEEQAEDGVAIWPEGDRDVRNFTVFIQGLSGETATVSGLEAAKGIILRKTLQLDYRVRGDGAVAGDDLVEEVGRRFIMR